MNYSPTTSTYLCSGAGGWLADFCGTLEPPAGVEDERDHLFSNGWPHENQTQ